MEKQHLLRKTYYFWGSLTAAVVYGVTQFPKLVNAATSQLLAKADREDLTEAVFIGMGLLVCLIGLFGLDRFRARHPRPKKTDANMENEITESASTQH